MGDIAGQQDWKNEYFVSISGQRKCGDYYGFASPREQAEFLKMSYDDILENFSKYGYKKAEIKQLNLFGVI